MNLSLHLQRLGLVGRQAAEVELHFLKMQRGILTHLLISLLPTVQLSKAKFLGAKRCPYISFSPSIRYSTTAMITFFELCGTGFGCCNDCSRCCCHNLRKAIYISMLLLNIYIYIYYIYQCFCWPEFPMFLLQRFVETTQFPLLFPQQIPQQIPVVVAATTQFQLLLPPGNSIQVT